MLQPYLSAEAFVQAGGKGTIVRNETLEAIYLDTASLTCIDEIPEKVSGELVYREFPELSN